MKILETHPEIKSREVLLGDSQRLLQYAKEMHKLCFEPIGMYPGGEAVAHVQVAGKDPLRFFVKKDGTIYINPVITSQKQKYKHREGCLSFANESPVEVERYNLIEVEFVLAHITAKQIVTDGGQKGRFSGKDAAIFQHEIEHFDLDLIY